MSDESRSTSKDLVARLRPVESRGERTIWTDAADEIERLRARIAELEGLLHDLLLLDESIGNRLRLPHGWSDEDKRRHALELTAREQKQTDARKAIGHLLEPCHQTPGMECSIAGPCAHYREAHTPRTVTHIPDSSGLTLPQLVAGKEALYACSEDPSFDDVRRVIAAVARATQRNNRPASREGE